MVRCILNFEPDFNYARNRVDDWSIKEIIVKISTECMKGLAKSEKWRSKKMRMQLFL